MSQPTMLLDFRGWKIFLFEASLFTLALVLGILNSLMIRGLFTASHSYLEPVSINTKDFLVWFFSATGFILWFVYFVKSNKGKKIFFKTLFLIAVVLGNILFFNIWLPGLFSVLITAFITWSWSKKRYIIIHNLFLIFAASAIAGRLGLGLRPETMVILLLVFSVYDYIAVYKTKHMVKMAREMIEQRVIIGIVIPLKVKDFLAKLEEVKTGGRFLVLGAGDIVFPLLLSVSLLGQSIFYSLIVAFFSLIGLFVGFLIFSRQSERRPMPALPPIALIAIIGYFITRII